MAVQLADKITPLTPEVAVKAIVNGYRLVTGKSPTKVVLGMLMGQSALETGHWKIIHNYNFGNMKSGKNDEFFQVYGTHDDPTDPGAHYAAYQSADTGAAAYIAILKRRAHWWEGLHSGTPEGFIAGLTTPPVYFTANPTRYLNELVGTMGRYAGLAGKYSGSVIGSLLGLFVLVGTAVLGYKKFSG